MIPKINKINASETLRNLLSIEDIETIPTITKTIIQIHVKTFSVGISSSTANINT